MNSGDWMSIVRRLASIENFIIKVKDRCNSIQMFCLYFYDMFVFVLGCIIIIIK